MHTFGKFFVSALLATSTASAQMMTGFEAPKALPTPKPAAANAASPAPQQVAASQPQTPSGGVFESATAERFVDKIFDVNSDSIDANGNLKWKGKTFSVGNSRLVRARFERYLSMPDKEGDYKKYCAILAEITALLSADNDSLSEESVRRAWSRLFDAAEYPVDGDSSLVIANLVYLSWRMRDEYGTFKNIEEEKERDVKRAESIASDRAEFLEYAADKVARENSAKGSRKAPTVGTAELGYKVKDLQKQIAELATAKLQKEGLASRAVLQFQSQIFAFIMERKFQQAQIAAMFYRHIYRANAQTLKVGRQQIKSLFQISNFTPTSDALESIAVSARKDIADSVASVDTLFGRGDRFGAFERLMEAFPLGENDTLFAVYPYEKRRVLHKIYKSVITLGELADAKDWAGAEQVVAEISEIADDFPKREILAKIKTAQRASDMYLLSAKQSAAVGDSDAVVKNVEKAAAIWPLNPAIADFNEKLLELAKGAAVYSKKFDENYQRGNLRDIVDEAPEYAVAFKNDSARAEKLRAVVVKISQVDSLIAQAAEFERQKSPYFAWDILENAVKIVPDDPVLARTVARLAPEVSDYVKNLNRAKAAEDAGAYAAALNYYLAARKIFPASQACRKGIERVAEKY